MDAYDTIIVGGGIAGLTAAAYLAREGKNILLLEKNEQCGGLLNTFECDGFYFEAGVRALDNAGIIFPMLQELGIELETIKSKVSIGIEEKVIDVESPQSLIAYQNLLLQYYPKNAFEIMRLISLIEQVMREMETLCGIDNPHFKDLKHDHHYFWFKLLPWVPKMMRSLQHLHRMHTPMELYLAHYISNDDLLDNIIQHFSRATPAFFALNYFSHYLDYFYPLGGVGKLTQALEAKIKQFGGAIKCQTTAVHINAHTQEVIDQRGKSYTYDHLIWAADLKHFYTHTLTEGLEKHIAQAFKTQRQAIEQSKATDSVFTLFLEVNLHPEYFSSVSHGHFFYSPSRKGLGNTNKHELWELTNPEHPFSKPEVIKWINHYTAHNTYEISIPALKDPSLAPPGKTGLIISVLADYGLFLRMQQEGWIEEFTLILEHQIIRVLTQSIYPRLQRNIIRHFSYSPLRIEQHIGSTQGAVSGWSFEQKSPVINQMHQSTRAILTPVPRIFQVGQWAYSPAGVPMSILTGKLASNRILKAQKKAKSKA